MPLVSSIQLEGAEEVVVVVVVLIGFELGKLNEMLFVFAHIAEKFTA